MIRFLKNLVIILISVSFFECSEESGELKLQIDDAEIHINHEKGRIDEPCVTTCTDIKFSLINASVNNFVLYNFNTRFFYAPRADSSFCEGGTAERFILVYDKRGKQILAISAIVPGSIEEPKTNDQLNDFERSIEKVFVLAKQIAKSKNSISFKERINLRNFELNPGEYYLKMVYFQHNISRYVTKEERQAIEEEFDAEMYKGCLWSNQVKLIVD
jgi:hypothetical protein